MRPGAREAVALVRLAIVKLPPEERLQLQQLRETALELGIPEETLWMFIPPAPPAQAHPGNRSARKRRPATSRASVRPIRRGARTRHRPPAHRPGGIHREGF